MATQAQTRPGEITFEDYLAMPEMQRRYEILDGEMIMPPTPDALHNWIVHDIAQLLMNFVLPSQLGVVITAPWDIMIRRKPLRTRQPDVCFISTRRSGFRAKEDLKGVDFIEFPPDLVVEVASPSNTPALIQQKLRDYHRIAVDEAWLVRPKERTVEVLQRIVSGWNSIGTFNDNESIRSLVLPGLSITVDQIFN